MFSFASLALFLIGAAGARAQFTTEELTFDVADLGKIQGINGNTTLSKRPYIQLLGIPYVDPPVGPDHRFKRAPAQTNITLAPGRIYTASDIKSCCFQPARNVLCTNRRSEDCLYLNIYTPYPQASAASLPVIFFIHGGSFVTGSGDIYNGKRLLEEDVVLVSINYRLGALGFLNLQTPDVPGNAGLYDILDALLWVKKYISHFGGDPELITVMGQSAGSAAATHLMFSPLTRDQNLFHRVIAMSGSAVSEWATVSAEKATVAALTTAALTSNCYTPGTLPDLVQIGNCMRAADANSVVNGTEYYAGIENLQGRLGTDAACPSIQAAAIPARFIEEDPLTVLNAENQAKVPLMAGTTHHDGSFVLAIVETTFAAVNNVTARPEYLRHEFVPQILRALGIEDRTDSVHENIAQYYVGEERMNSGNFTLMIPGLTDMFSVLFLKASAYKTLKSHSLIEPRSYWYSFDYAGENTVWSSIVPSLNTTVRHGVAHGDDLIYLFDVPLRILTSPEDLQISKKMVDYYVNFAYSGNPNTRNASEDIYTSAWKPHSDASPRFAIIDKEDIFVTNFPAGYWKNASDVIWSDLPEPQIQSCTSGASRMGDVPVLAAILTIVSVWKMLVFFE